MGKCEWGVARERERERERESGGGEEMCDYFCWSIFRNTFNSNLTLVLVSTLAGKSEVFIFSFYFIDVIYS